MHTLIICTTPTRFVAWYIFNSIVNPKYYCEGRCLLVYSSSVLSDAKMMSMHKSNLFLISVLDIVFDALTVIWYILQWFIHISSIFDHEIVNFFGIFKFRLLWLLYWTKYEYEYYFNRKIFDRDWQLDKSLWW